jgi:hypothetical protein
MNRAWCKERGIRMSGWSLGRRPAHVSKATKKQVKEEEKARQAIEEKFCQAKRRFNLDRVMAKLDNTSQTVIAIAFLVMNLVAGLRKLLWLFLRQFLLITTQLVAEIIKDYVPAS